MTTLGERINIAKEARKLRQKDIADHFGIKATSVFDWENDKTTPELTKVNRLAKFFGVNLQWLVDGEGPMDANTELHQHGSLEENMIPIRFAEVRPGMGGPGEVFGDGSVEYFRPRLLQKLKTRPDKLWAMEVEGDSMAPVLKAGDLIIVDTTKRDPSQAGVFVIWNGFGMVCKYVQHIPKSDPPAVRIKSYNTMVDSYDLTFGEPGEAESYIMGRVVWRAGEL